MDVKKIFIFCVVIHFNIFASVKVLFSNNSTNDYSISSQTIDKDTHLISGSDYQITDNLLVNEYQSNVLALKLNSNVNIKKEKKGHFVVLIRNQKHPNQELQFYITTKKHQYYFEITETYIILPSGEMLALNSNQNKSFVVPNWDNETFHFVPYQQNERGLWEISYVLAVDEDNKELFDFSNAYAFKAINYNIQLFPFYVDIISPPNNKKERALGIPRLIGDQYDYVSFNEVFDRDLRTQMIRDMSKFYPYSIDAAGMSNANFLSSGVLTFSKWPILDAKQLVYQSCTLQDCLVNKGVTYIKLRKNVNGISQNYNVFSTHLQSAKNSMKTCPYFQTRAKQIRELRDFIFAQHIPAIEPVFIAGDLNINKFEQIFENYHNQNLQTEYEYLLDTLNATDPVQTGLTYSFDGILNTMTSLVSKQRAHFDYILYLNDHKSPISAVNHIKTMRDTFNPRMYPIYDTSDHFPVIGKFIFAE